ncbi:hypothetical protein B0H11DRAFT_469059 [Mycena galericulata]|nr:hypothetical protein B0H11DRAFT_469059 [Mycena galericulata]
MIFPPKRTRRLRCFLGSPPVMSRTCRSLRRFPLLCPTPGLFSDLRANRGARALYPISTNVHKNQLRNETLVIGIMIRRCVRCIPLSMFRVPSMMPSCSHLCTCAGPCVRVRNHPSQPNQSECSSDENTHCSPLPTDWQIPLTLILLQLRFLLESLASMRSAVRQRRYTSFNALLQSGHAPRSSVARLRVAWYSSFFGHRHRYASGASVVRRACS